MAQVWRVTKAFLSTDKDTKEPQVVQTQGGGMHKYMVQVEDQPVAGWFSVLKKPGNEVVVGDELYGTITENNWGKPQFDRAQRPDGNFGGQQQAKTAQQDTGSINEKLDYIIVLLESMAGNTTKDSEPVDIDDAPVDLSQLDI